jgi:hypothetical protein
MTDLLTRELQTAEPAEPPLELHVTLRPHIERDGELRFHRDRFDVYLGDELICTHRSGWHTPPRRV